MTIPSDVKVLIDLALGDGWIGYASGVVNEDNANPRMTIGHSIKQYEYLVHKKKLLESYGFKTTFSTHIAAYGKNKGLEYCSLYVHTCPALKTAHKWLYNKKKKVLDKALLRQIDVQTLAYWFMDDGTARLARYLKKNHTDHSVQYTYELPKINAYKFCTCDHTYEENALFVDCLKERFDIEAKVLKDGKFFSVHIFAITEKDKFRYLIEPHIIPSMYYKIAYPHGFAGVPYTKEVFQR